MKKISSKIKSLDKYINEALYDKTNGYYSNKNPFGHNSDFLTSPIISVLFSEMLLIWTILFWKYLKCPKKFNYIELGAGNGEMMHQIITASKKYPKFNKSTNFFIYEKSEYLIKLQKKKLKNYNVIWINDFKKLKKNYNLFVGNEFLDAFSIKQFEKKNSVWFEKFIEEKNKVNEIKNIKVNIKNFEKKVDLNLSKDQNFIEFSNKQLSFCKEVSKILSKYKGGILLIDYGFNDGKMFNSLQSVKNHKKANYLINKGSTDITHLVNFDLLKKIFKKHNLKVNNLATQRDFLSRMGIFERANILASNKSFLKKADIFYRLKRLTDKKEMGEVFKVFFASTKSIKFNYGF